MYYNFEKSILSKIDFTIIYLPSDNFFFEHFSVNCYDFKIFHCFIKILPFEN